MSFLCSNLTDVRKVALDVLFTVRELHGKLLQAGGRSAPVTPVTPAPSIANPPTPGKHSLQAITPCHHTITYIWQFTFCNDAFNKMQCLVCSNDVTRFLHDRFAVLPLCCLPATVVHCSMLS